MERNRLEDLGINGGIILNLIVRMVDEGIYWIQAAQDL
jgi:hypothetical protein